MDSLTHLTHFLMINKKLKQAYLSCWKNFSFPNELVYSDNLEDIDTQLLFHGFKILKNTEQHRNIGTVWHAIYYDLESI